MTTTTLKRTAESIDFSQAGSSIGLGDTWNGRSVAEARKFVVTQLGFWHIDPATTDDAVLVASELVTNAFIHATGAVWLGVDRLGEAVLISVHDASPSPVPHHVLAGEESGRGLGIVRHLARSFGSSRYAQHKVVWAVLSPSTTEFDVKET
jgi:anti-sigma regulatory factor (Ser/Thr protein kinase)